MTTETKNNPWQLYDQLIDSIPCNLEVVDCLVGVHWVLVRSVGVGIAMTPPEGDRCLGLAGTMRGKGLHDCATSQIVELDGSRCRCGRDQFFFQRAGNARRPLESVAMRWRRREHF